MRGKTVLVVSQGTANRRRVDAPLASAGNQVIRAKSADEALARLERGDVDLALVDHDTIREIPSILEVTRARVPMIALATRSQSEGLLELVCDHGVHNLLARKPAEGDRASFDPGEVLVTVEKIFRGDVFGVEKYLPGFGIEVESRVLTRAGDREPAIERVRDFVGRLGAGSQMSSTVGIVADELITNAVYNAPRDPDGTPRYAAKSRREKIELAPEEYVSLAMGSNGEKFALSVVDQFGGFTGDALRSGLRRCLVEGDPIEQKEGGAGIGLYMVLSSCSQLVINVAPGRSTEVIALWDLEKRLRGVRLGGHSLHLFVDETGEGASAGALRAAPRAAEEFSMTEPVDIPSRAAAGGKAAGGGGFEDEAEEDTAPGTAFGRGEGVAVAAPPRALGAEEASASPDLAFGESGSRDSFDEHAVTEVLAGAIDAARAPEPPPRDAAHLGWSDGSSRLEALEGLREVLLLPPPESPALRDSLARIHHATTASDAVSAALTYICSRWSAVALLVRRGEEFQVWCGAGDIHDWDALLATPIGAERFEVLLSQSQTPVARMAPNCAEPIERDLARHLIGEEEAATLVLSITLKTLGEVVLFAAREPVSSWHSVIPYERVLWQVFVRLKRLLRDDD